jgi:hypothetical protein
MKMTTADKIHTGLSARIPEVLRADPGDRWLLIAGTAGRTVEARYEGDLVRFVAGRVVHAVSAESDDELEHVLDVAVALHAGNATELFGYAADGTFGFVGHEITAIDDSFRYARVDEGARVLVRRPN